MREKENHVLGRLREGRGEIRVPRGTLQEKPSNRALESDFEENFFYNLVLHIEEVRLHISFA